jgi:hypothetical protein
MRTYLAACPLPHRLATEVRPLSPGSAVGAVHADAIAAFQVPPAVGSNSLAQGQESEEEGNLHC